VFHVCALKNVLYLYDKPAEYLSDVFPIRNGLKQPDAFISNAFQLCITHAIRRIQVKQDGMKLNGIHQLLVYADVNIRR